MGTRVEGTAIQGVHHFEKRTAKEGVEIGGTRQQGTRIESVAEGSSLWRKRKEAAIEGAGVEVQE